MKYTKGNIGRLFLLKFDDGDVLLKKIEELAKKEKIKAAAIVFIGALKKGNLAAGPKKPVVPPQPYMIKFKDGWEVMGIGTIFSASSGPQIHIHASMGQNRRVLTGCVRKDSKVFLVIEAIVFELKGIKAAKSIDPETGINLLKIL